MIEIKTNFYPPSHTTFRHGDLVSKKSGSQWRGRVCGWYATENNPEGYVVESVYEPGSAQLFPARALELKGDTPWLHFPLPDVPPVSTVSTKEKNEFARNESPSLSEPGTFQPPKSLGDAPSATPSGPTMKRRPLPRVDSLGHRTRFSDSSVYDYKCVCCGATDAWGDTRLDRPCPTPDGWDRRIYFQNDPPKGFPTNCPHCRYTFYCREEHHPQDHPIAVVDPNLDRQVSWKCPNCLKEWAKTTETPDTL